MPAFRVGWTNRRGVAFRQSAGGGLSLLASVVKTMACCKPISARHSMSQVSVTLRSTLWVKRRFVLSYFATADQLLHALLTDFCRTRASHRVRSSLLSPNSASQPFDGG